MMKGAASWSCVCVIIIVMEDPPPKLRVTKQAALWSCVCVIVVVVHPPSWLADPPLHENVMDGWDAWPLR